MDNHTHLLCTSVGNIYVPAPTPPILHQTTSPSPKRPLPDPSPEQVVLADIPRSTGPTSTYDKRSRYVVLSQAARKVWKESSGLEAA